MLVIVMVIMVEKLSALNVIVLPAWRSASQWSRIKRLGPGFGDVRHAPLDCSRTRDEHVRKRKILHLVEVADDGADQRRNWKQSLKRASTYEITSTLLHLISHIADSDR